MIERQPQQRTIVKPTYKIETWHQGEMIVQEKCVYDVGVGLPDDWQRFIGVGTVVMQDPRGQKLQVNGVQFAIDADSVDQAFERYPDVLAGDGAKNAEAWLHEQQRLAMEQQSKILTAGDDPRSMPRAMRRRINGG